MAVKFVNEIRSTCRNQRNPSAGIRCRAASRFLLACPLDFLDFGAFGTVSYYNSCLLSALKNQLQTRRKPIKSRFLWSCPFGSNFFGPWQQGKNWSCDSAYCNYDTKAGRILSACMPKNVAYLTSPKNRRWRMSCGRLESVQPDPRLQTHKPLKIALVGLKFSIVIRAESIKTESP